METSTVEPSPSQPLDTTTTTTNTNPGQDELETAKWTRYLPEAFGIRKAMRASNYRWCAREAGMWGIATGTVMALHRFRMQSRIGLAVHVGFLTLLSVNFGSYYFCVKRRDYQERTIELLMKQNQFLSASEMPEEIPIDNHPFVRPVTEEKNGSETTRTTTRRGLPERQYVVNLPERKEWQPPIPTRDASEVFQPQDTMDGKLQDQGKSSK